MIERSKILKIPEIRIRYGWILQNQFAKLRDKIPEYAEKKFPPKERGRLMAQERAKLWEKDGSRILKGMSEITELEFYKKTIDVNIIYGIRAFSDPLTMGFIYEGDQFVDVLTHELLHNILTDNTDGVHGAKWAAAKYPEIEDRKATNHILIHAVHKEIYLNVLKSPERLKDDIEKCQEFPSYKLAWDIVERDGHLNIINDFKKSYAK